jgi:hypothetical protein
MKSLRFASVVAKSGKPDVHLTLVDPARDAALQKAIKAGRVMTVHQSRGAADYGTVGFEKNTSGQILIFPKSLKSFERTRIVGVKYELLDGASSSPTRSPRPSKPAARIPSARKKRARPRASEKTEPPPDKVVHFPEPSEDEEEQEITELKEEIRHAMRMLEQGKQVAAFNLLKRLVT